MRKIILLLLSLALGTIAVVSVAKAQASIEPRGPDNIPVPMAVQIQSTPSPVQYKSAVLGDETSQPPATTTPDSDGKEIIVTLKNQTLQYFQDGVLVGQFKISSGIKGMETPTGTFSVLKKVPVEDYKGVGYDYKNTKWNLRFINHSPLNYYIHGTYWHHNFGHPMSHGCINVSYANMQPLYNWAEVGTKVVIE